MRSIPKETTVKLTDIICDPGVQARSNLSQDVIDRYAADIAMGAAFPPVIIFYHDEQLWLADGFLRYYAFTQAGYNAVPARLVPGTRDDAIRYAAASNRNHGVYRTPEDLKKVVGNLRNLADRGLIDDSDVAIGEICGILESDVASYRPSCVQQSSNKTAAPGGCDEIVHAARAIADDDGVRLIGPKTAQDISELCGTTVRDVSGRRFLFGQECPPAEHTAGLGEPSIADSWYQFRYILEPFYWMASSTNPGTAVSCIPLHARASAWDAMTVVIDWLHNAERAWTEQFRDPNRINPDTGVSTEDSALPGIVMPLRWKHLDDEAYRTEKDSSLLDEVNQAIDRLRAHISSGESRVPDDNILRAIKYAIAALLDCPTKNRVSACSETARVALSNLVSMAKDGRSDSEAAAQLDTLSDFITVESQDSRKKA